MSKIIDADRLPYRPCVGVMLLNAENKVFGGQRLDNPGPAWQMPQGGIDAGEAPRAAAIRELTEETGVSPDKVEILRESSDWLSYDLPADQIGILLGGRYRGQKQKWFALRFLGQDSDVNIATADPEFSTWRWMSSQELVDAIVPFKRALYVDVFREFSDLLSD